MAETKDRPKKLDGKTHKVKTGCGGLYVIVNRDEDGNVFEIFAKLGKSGGCASAQIEGLTRAISIGLRSGVEVQEYYHTLINIKCSSPALDKGKDIFSCADAIAKVIKEYITDEKDN